VNTLAETNKKSVVYSIALAIVALSWGTSYAIIKDALNSIEPFTLMTARFGLSTILLSLIYYKKLIKIKKQDMLRGSIIGIFMFLSFVTLVTGIGYTTASKQSFIIGAYVLIVPLFAWIINKKKPTIYAIFGTIIATIGIGLLTIDASLIFNIGDIISLFCSVFFACHMVTIEKFSKNSDPILLTIIQFAVTSILFIILTGVFESYDFTSVSKAYPSVAYLVIVTTVIAFVVQNVAQKHISSTSTALILTLESAFGSVFAVYLLNEKMSTQMIVGCVVIFFGIITQETRWNFLKFKRNQKQDEKDNPCKNI
jgi:drug/metabolite transporter (DMT)-like permease